MPCKVLACDPEEPDPRVVREAASVVRRGGLVAFPTETVYGLGADTFNEAAVLGIFRAKGRPPDNPLIVHIASMDDFWLVARSVPESAWRLAERAWPGPLTIVVPRDPRVPKSVTAGLDSVAVRMPAHPVALELIKASETPIAAPSANISGRPSPTRAEHVVSDLCDRIDLVIDGGETFMGVESTIIDFTRDPPVLLRPGPYPVDKVEEIIGSKVIVTNQARGFGEADRPLAPGMKYKHYSPDTPLVLVEYTGDLEELVESVRSHVARALKEGKRPAILASDETRSRYRDLEERGAKVLSMGSRRSLAVVARRLYHGLRLVDEIGVDLAVVEGYPEEGIGLAIMNRLRKAAMTFPVTT